jgi:hypothetical protein
MGILDDFKNSFGEDSLTPTTGVSGGAQNWRSVCVCGHLDRYHSTTVGGVFELEQAADITVGGRPLRSVKEFYGCRGAMVSKGQATVVTVRDMDATPPTVTETYLATCPCEEFHAIAKVDRPNRYWNQRIPSNLTDPVRHPFAIGIRAFSTFLAGRKQTVDDPDWATAEFDRRFEWTSRRCAISSCKATDDVWPVYISTAEPLISELRCPAHR